MSEYCEATIRFIANIGGRNQGEIGKGPMTIENFRSVMLDFMKECELEFSDLQYMPLSLSVLTKWLEENKKPFYWANIMQSMVKNKSTKEINKIHHLCSVLFPEYPWRVYLFPLQSWKVKQN